MSDDDIRSRNDFAPPPGTLPPQAKTYREVAHGIRDIGIPFMCLMAAHWGLVGGDVFLFAVATVLGGNFALRRSEGHLP